MNIREPVFCSKCNHYLGDVYNGIYSITCLKDNEVIEIVARTFTDERCPECGRLLCTQ